MAWPTTPLTIEVGLALGADPAGDPTAYSYTDVTAYTYDRNGDQSITINRGRQDEQSQDKPSTINVELKNTDYRFTDGNPTGAYYPNIRRNTPLRVRVDYGSGLTSRGVGFVAEWPPEWNTPETDFWVNVEAAGTTRRLAAGAIVKSCLRRTLTFGTSYITANPPQAYWTMEDGTDAAGFGSEISGGYPLNLTGTVTLASRSDLVGAIDMPAFTATTSLSGAVNGTFLTGWQVGWMAYFTAQPTTRTTLMSVTVANGSAYRWTFEVDSTTFYLTGYDSAGTVVHSNSNGFTVPLNKWLSGTITVDTTTGAATCGLTDLTNLSSSVPISSASIVAGSPINVSVPASSQLAGMAMGHLVVYSGYLVLDMNSPARGFEGEVAALRWERLCKEAGQQYVVSAGDSADTDTDTMGPQLPGTLLDLLRECVEVCEGTMFDRLDGKLGLETLDNRTNAVSFMTLNYATGQVSPPLKPIKDDQRLRNDVTVTRVNGSAARAVDTSGPVGTAAVGTYADSADLNLYDDTQPVNHAGWRLNLGTVDRMRFPTITVDLRQNSSLDGTWLSVDIGTRITVTNLPDGISFDDLDLVVEGYTETISQYSWVVTFNCAPWDPYNVGYLSNTSGDTGAFTNRLDCDPDCAIRGALTTTATSVPFDPLRYRWTTDSDDMTPNIPIRVAGERMNVSGISTTAATFVAAGALASADNAAATATLYAGAAADDWIVLVGRIRSGSNGTITAPAGYSRVNVRNMSSASPTQIWVKKHSGSESNPAVTPAGGAAGDTVSAFTLGLRNMPIAWTDVNTAVVEANGMSNGSAQNINYPGLAVLDGGNGAIIDGCVILIVGGKDDDWTSVATLTGATEAVDASTVTGNDQGLVADYIIQTASTPVPHGAFVVTGGTNAVSEGIAVAFAGGYQTMTVTRSVNGVVKAQSASAKISVENPLRMNV